MKIPITIVALTFSSAPSYAGDKAAPAPARVVMTGKATSFIQASSVRAEIRAGEDVQKKMEESLKQVTATTFSLGEKAGVVVVLPANTFKLEDALKVLNAPMAVEGTLGSTDHALLIATAGATGAKRMPLLVVDKLVLLDDANKSRFPAENYAAVEGVVVEGEVKVGGEVFGWAIRNGGGLIPLALPKGATPPAAGAVVRASGRVRMIGDQLTLAAAKVEVVKK